MNKSNLISTITTAFLLIISNSGYPQQNGWNAPFIKVNKDAPNILAWEIGNELSIGNVPGISDLEKADFVANFMRRMAQIIQGIDQQHMITTGMTSTAKAWMRTNEDHDLRRYLYDPFDFVTIHYPRDKPNPFGNNTDDVDLAKNFPQPKPFIIEEDLVCKPGFKIINEVDHDAEINNGCEPCSDRRNCFEHHLEEWLGSEDHVGRGASGYMVWGFDVAEISDGDPGGIGLKNPSDVGELRNLFSTYAEKLRQSAQNT